jgi:phosphoglycolate phosphatase
MVGDTTHDLQMAANAGVRGVAVTYGAHPRDQLLALQPLACIDKPHDLSQWLRENA